jgi:NTP pyrophosphatase (non-canonical NTP hydrolase)
MMETFDEYQEVVAETVLRPITCKPMDLWFDGMVEELGEIAGKRKRIHRDGNGRMYAPDVQAMVKECGDLLYYLTCFAKELGYTLEQIADMNANKVLSRQARGVLKGEGDDR